MEERRSTDRLFPEFLQELGAIRVAVETLNVTLQETRQTVKEVGDLAVKTDNDFRSLRYGIKLSLVTASVFMGIIIGGLGYYFNQRDTRLETLTGEVKQLAQLAITNLAENKRQTEVDNGLTQALTEALKAIKETKDAVRR